MSEPITTEEKYARAVNSSHLEMRPGMDAISVIIAAGWVRDGLGTILYRLRTEHDAAKGDIRRIASQPEASQTDAALVAGKLKSLHSATLAVRRFAINSAKRHAGLLRYHGDDAPEVAVRALGYWLDPLCHSCNGRGFSGGTGTPVEVCKHCHGSGRTLPRLSKTEAGQQFGYLLISEFERKTTRVGELIKRHLRQEAA
jgi:hypothetical protein